MPGVGMPMPGVIVAHASDICQALVSLREILVDLQG